MTFTFDIADDCCGHEDGNIISCSHVLQGERFQYSIINNIEAITCGNCQKSRLFPVCKQCLLESMQVIED